MRSSQVAVVTRFELARTLRKPQFWIAALLLPAILSAVVLVVAWAGNAKPEAKPITFEYTDKSGLISDAVASALGGSAARRLGLAPATELGRVNSLPTFSSRQTPCENRSP